MMRSGRRRLFRTRLPLVALIAAALLLFVGANVHLAYVAFESQTDCVPHLKEKAGVQGEFRAAKSAC